MNTFTKADQVHIIIIFITWNKRFCCSYENDPIGVKKGEIKDSWLAGPPSNFQLPEKENGGSL